MSVGQERLSGGSSSEECRDQGDEDRGDEHLGTECEPEAPRQRVADDRPKSTTDHADEDGHQAPDWLHARHEHPGNQPDNDADEQPAEQSSHLHARQPTTSPPTPARAEFAWHDLVMDLSSGPLAPPIEPMLAKAMEVTDLTLLRDVAFEPKWDGFRCLLFRTVHGIVMQGRGRSRTPGTEFVDLGYAFPEIVAAAASQLPVGAVLDAEIVAIRDGRLDFALLSSRLRPRSEAAGPSIGRLAIEAPASLLAFDLLACPDSMLTMPFSSRRARLESLASGWSPPLLLTPSTTDPHIAGRWFEQFESSGVDGLIVKPAGEPYSTGKRTQGKIKHRRTADAVVAGWRGQTSKDGRIVVGSLLLGLHDAAGGLHFVGGASAFTAQMRTELLDHIGPFLADNDPTHPWSSGGDVTVPGGSSRWSKGKDWRPLSPSLVAEVSYDQIESNRFRHSVGFLRWRPDREAESCTFEQLPTLDISSIEELLQA